jgi:hypothetical protein
MSFKDVVKSFQDSANLVLVLGEHKLHLNFEVGYFNASKLCLHIQTIYSSPRCTLENWRATVLAKQLYDMLVKDYMDPEKSKLDPNNPEDVFLHTCLLTHFVTWVSPNFNRPYSYLLETAWRHAMESGMEEIKVHTVAVYEVSPNYENPLQRYYILESKLHNLPHKTNRLLTKHPHMTNVFLHHGVRDTNNVIARIKSDFENDGKVSINSKNYCGSFLREVDVLEYIFKLCKVDERPSIMRSSYDVVDGEDHCTYF